MPRKRLTLFRQLDRIGVPVTAGGERNLALAAAVDRMQRLVATAMRSPEAKRYTPSRGRTSPRRDMRIVRPQLWAVDVTRSSVRSHPLVIACDGSFDAPTGNGAVAAVSTAGDVRAASVDAVCAPDVELLALLAGIELGSLTGTSALTLLSDSLAAIDRLEEMVEGDGCGASDPMTERFLGIRSRVSFEVTVHHVQARIGNHLHDAADAVAYSVRRASTRPRLDVEEMVMDIVADCAESATAGEGSPIPEQPRKTVAISSA